MAAAVTSPPDVTGPSTARSWLAAIRDRIEPFHLFALVAGFAALFIAAGSLSDPDLYWHIPVGRDIVHGHHITGAGSGLTFTVDGSHWKTTQWLSEVGLYGLHAWTGYGGIRALTILVAAAILVLLYRSMVREAGSVAVPSLLFAVIAITIAPHFEDRPQTLSLLFLAALTPYFLRLLRGAPARGTLWLALGTWFWANVHGYWVLVPATLILLAVCRYADNPARATLLDTLKPANQAIVTVVAACLTPIGPGLLTSVYRFKSSTKIIAEWGFTSVGDVGTWALVAIVAAFLVSWGRSTDRVPRGEVLFVLGWLGFSLLAYRNVLPAVILLAPLSAARLTRAVRVPSDHRTARERRLLLVAVGVITVGGIGALLARVGSTPTLPNDAPLRLYALLRAQPGTHRVLDDYNHSGQLLAFGGPRTKVAVDGRTDLYGADYLNRYVDMMNLGKGWKQTFAGLDANYALVRTDAAIRYVLDTRGWTLLGRQGKFSLYAAPTPTAP